uniref:Uncharacterized protein n=1 Tax=Oryza punctata TaxID=4537 RepID=A0A0E0KAM4_ORYPU
MVQPSKAHISISAAASSTSHIQPLPSGLIAHTNNTTFESLIFYCLHLGGCGLQFVLLLSQPPTFNTVRLYQSLP